MLGTEQRSIEIYQLFKRTGPHFPNSVFMCILGTTQTPTTFVNVCICVYTMSDNKMILCSPLYATVNSLKFDLLTEEASNRVKEPAKRLSSFC
jgi:hypothetical protein